MTRRTRTRAGLSLIEMVVVMAIMIVALSLSVLRLGDITARARQTQGEYNDLETTRIGHLWEAAGGWYTGSGDLASLLESTPSGTTIAGAVESPDSLLIRIQPQ